MGELTTMRVIAMSVHAYCSLRVRDPHPRIQYGVVLEHKGSLFDFCELPVQSGADLERLRENS